jgi:phosphohistidine phosphatase
MPELVILRHARAQASDGGFDSERHLAQEGQAQARKVGLSLQAEGFVPDLALVSSSARSRETFALVAVNAGWDLEPVVSDELYRAYTRELLDMLREIGAEVARVLVVGHEPTCSHVAGALAGPGSDAAALARIRRGLPTAGRAYVDTGGPWSGIGHNPSRLTATK